MMKPISLATFLAAMLMLGVSLLWFPDICAIINALMPAGTPDYISEFLVFLPFLTLTIILIIQVIRMSKRGRTKPFDSEE